MNAAASSFRGALRYGTWAVVTGASSGIGHAFAEYLAAEGLSLVLVARSQSVLDALAGSLSRAHNVETIVVAADLGLADGLAAVEAATERIDVGLFVSAAGFGTSGAFLNAALEPEREMLDVNCWATVVLSRTFAQRFVARGRGGIVLFSSLLGWQGAPFAAHYAATKSFVQALAEGLRVELAPAGVDVIACAPGPVSSGFATRAHLTMRQTAKPADIPAVTIRALGRRDTVVPDSLSKFLTYSLRMMPRAARVRTMGKIMLGMTK